MSIHSTPIAGLNPQQAAALASAHQRFLRVVGISAGATVGQRQAEIDRLAFGHRVQFSADGRPRISGATAADFMVAICRLPHKVCAAWSESEFRRMLSAPSGAQWTSHGGAQ